MGGPLSPVKELIHEQRRLATQVITEDCLPSNIRVVAGTDAAFPDQGRTTRAAIVALSYPDLTLLEQVVADIPTQLPYIPGLLSFRELPAILKALTRLSVKPDLVLCDGQGFAHPRRFGVACHLGVATGLCTIGVAKSKLIGQAPEPGTARGSMASLQDGEDRVGYVLRTRANVRPVFVSSGHRVSPETATELVLRCTTRFRLPEPVRLADRLAGQAPAS